ncbi:hypothetical protein [Radiobacillus sp. PE A8.2]|uniref:hypothetical protein n=1 Tax=Radiobacillus sp. PE A8.2 TaxID=3380349 RepID=UPI00388E8001
MMNNKEARIKTVELVKESLAELIQDNGICGEDDSKEYAEMLFNDYKEHFNSIMEMPYGSNLPPEEIAEGILYKHVSNLSSNESNRASLFNYQSTEFK